MLKLFQNGQLQLSISPSKYQYFTLKNIEEMINFIFNVDVKFERNWIKIELIKKCQSWVKNAETLPSCQLQLSISPFKNQNFSLKKIEEMINSISSTSSKFQYNRIKIEWIKKCQSCWINRNFPKCKRVAAQRPKPIRKQINWLLITQQLSLFNRRWRVAIYCR